jgi:Peptidase family M50
LQEPFGPGPPPLRPGRADHRPVIELIPGPDGVRAQPEHRPRYALAITLFLLTVGCTITLGAHWALAVRTDAVSDLAPILGIPLLLPSTVARVWGDPALLAVGLEFALPALFILLCHELGHYIACRRYGLPSTLPYFLPLPAFFGTLGAFIRIKAPIRNKRELFDVGVAGPLAGFVALLPFLFYGIAASTPVPLPQAVSFEAANGWLPLPGRNLAFALVSRLFHGPLPPGYVLDLHPFALAAWFGLLATALNLLPLSQLDGGHILYAVFGRLQRRAAVPLWAAVGLLGLLWPGWFLWCFIVVLMGLRHPPVRDEAERLDRRRLVLAVVALAILVLSFLPVPLVEVPIHLDAPPPPAATQPAGQVA